MDNSTKIFVGVLCVGVIYLLYENMQKKNVLSNNSTPSQASVPQHHNAYPLLGQKPAPTAQDIIRKKLKGYNLPK